MKSKIIFLTIILVQTIVTATLNANEYYLDFSVGYPWYEMFNGSRQAIELSKTAPEGLTVQPKFKSEKPLYGSVKLGPSNNVYFFILDETGGTGKSYDVVYFDTNNNRDLTDDKPVGICAVRYDNNYFGPIKTCIDYGNGLSLYYGFLDYSPQTNRVSISTTGYSVGKAKFGDKEHKIAVIDANGNGLFNDQHGKYWKHDRILVDVNDDGVFSTYYWDFTEKGPYAKYLKVGNEYYIAEISSDGTKINITKPEIVFGTVQLSEKLFDGAVISEEVGLFPAKTDNGKISLPPGKYAFVSNTIKRKDNSGQEVKLEYNNFPDKPSFEVKAGETTEFKYGEPITAKLKHRKRGDKYLIDIAFVDIAGMEYRLGGERTRPSPPQIKILDINGNLLETKSFQYG